MIIHPSPEIERIAALPRRKWSDDELGALCARLTTEYKTPKGTMSLWPKQARVLAEAYQKGGCYASLPVGAGKTLVSFLLPVVMQAKTPLLMVPASLKEKTFSDFIELREHWKAPRAFPVISLEQIQTPNSRKILDSIAPDLIIIDEAQNIASHRSTRTRRIIEYMNNNPKTMMVALTGTPLRLSVMDYWHIVRSCLKGDSPLPASRPEMEKWAEAIDVEVSERREPGALGRALGSTGLHGLRDAFKDRLRDTWGFVSIVESSCDMPIKLRLDSNVEVPVEVMDAVERVRDTGETINQDLLESGAHVRSHIGQLANGFCYYWDPPPPDHWRRARRAWHGFVRDELERDHVTHDSPALVAEAYPDHPLLQSWREVKDEYDPDENRTVKWLSDYALRWAMRSVGSIPSIIWVKEVEIGNRLEKMTGWRYFGGGPDNSRDLVAFAKSKQAGQVTIILSISAHHQGKNLQAWSRVHYLTCPSSVPRWEQSIGRVHRPGQGAMVQISVFAPLKELCDSFSKALDRSKFIYETTGQLQKLLDAKIVRKKKKL